MLNWSPAGLSADERASVRETLALLDIPARCIDTAEVWPEQTTDCFLRRAAFTALTPGGVIPGQALLRHLSLRDPLAGTVLRRAAELALQLSPLSGMGCEALPGGHLVGCSLLVAHPDADGIASLTLPDGVWTDLLTGEEYTGCVRTAVPLRTQLLLCAPNALIPALLEAGFEPVTVSELLGLEQPAVPDWVMNGEDAPEEAPEASSQDTV